MLTRPEAARPRSRQRSEITRLRLIPKPDVTRPRSTKAEIVCRKTKTKTIANIFNDKSTISCTVTVISYTLLISLSN